MANYSSKLVDPADTYVDYTSNVFSCNQHSNSNSHRGVVQVDWTSGTIVLQGRVSPDAPWFDIKSYTASAMEEIVLPYQLRAEVTTGEGAVYVGEVL